MLLNRMFAATLLLAIAASLTSRAAQAEDAIGVTPTEIKIGTTFPFSGPASVLGNVGKALIGYVNYINDRGGVSGRKINLIALDDAYTPSKSVELNRRLVESDEVAFLFSPLGTASISAVLKYANNRKVPHLFVVSGANKFTNGAEFPYTTTGLPSFEVEGKVYARYISQNKPGARIAVLYQNDDMGKDLLKGVRSYLKDDFDKLVTARSYEITDPTVDSQIVTLKSTGAEVIFFGGSPKFAAQALRRIREINWNPLIVLNLAASTVAGALVPAGLENAKGVVSSTFFKDPMDPNWANDPDVIAYKAFLAKYIPGGDVAEQTYTVGYVQGEILAHVLEQCGDDLSRENILKQALNIKSFSPSLVLPGISINTSAENHQAWTTLQLQQFNGTTYVPVGNLINAD
ncbi:ABC transporter substrate-binding protein [Bradyrhizobium sp. CCBAU 51627]|uniref:ABC transporter substrate-binding protein n=1 Tax=Bradyrhizobium sp. CCBAU 51627 TaxID=1325088 RepID=UPI0023061836|nr:ABC transporter substrate-binding protein [Bradyrhizobium sp. CCBAU 51627]